MSGDTSGPPELSVVVPVHDGMGVLPRCVEALRASELEPTRWDVTIVDDGSTDGTGAWARDKGLPVVTIPDGPRGPAAARNAGVERVRGAVVVFVDADVQVHRDALRRFADIFAPDVEVAAAFGAYDEQPGARGFVSEYRNLYHRYVHLRGAGSAETFWTGCGAVRREVFVEAGGFDVKRFPRPQIEDIELGYRIRDAGWTILLDPAIQCTHLKRWTFGSVLRTDLLDRGIPWMRLLLERPRTSSLNVGPAERARTALVGTGVGALLLAAGGVLLRTAEATTVPLAFVGVLAICGAVLSNHRLYRWFAERRGWAFALGVVPMNLLHYSVSCVAAAVGVFGYYGARLNRETS